MKSSDIITYSSYCGIIALLLLMFNNGFAAFIAIILAFFFLYSVIVCFTHIWMSDRSGTLIFLMSILGIYTSLIAVPLYVHFSLWKDLSFLDRERRLIKATFISWLSIAMCFGVLWSFFSSSTPANIENSQHSGAEVNSFIQASLDTYDYMNSSFVINPMTVQVILIYLIFRYVLRKHYQSVDSKEK